MPEQGVLVAKLRPFWGRVLVTESVVDEEQRESGLIVPLKHDGDDGVKRGVVTHIDLVWDENTPGRAIADQLAPGTVVFFRGGIRIADVVVLEPTEILAFESDE